MEGEEGVIEEDGELAGKLAGDEAASELAGDELTGGHNAGQPYFTDSDTDGDDGNGASSEDNASGGEEQDSTSTSESETDDEEPPAQEEGGDEVMDGSSWRLPRLVYEHLPPSQRERDEAVRKGKEPPKAHRSRNFYQIKSISEILFHVPIFPVDLSNSIDPECFLLCVDGWGM